MVSRGIGHARSRLAAHFPVSRYLLAPRQRVRYNLLQQLIPINPLSGAHRWDEGNCEEIFKVVF